MMGPTQEFMGSSQLIITFSEAENTGGRGGLCKSLEEWEASGQAGQSKEKVCHANNTNKSNVPASEGVDPQKQKVIIGLGNESPCMEERRKPQRGI